MSGSDTVDSLNIRIDAFLTNAIESDGSLLVHPSPDVACRVRAKLWFTPESPAVNSARTDARGECYRPGVDMLVRGERFEHPQALLANVPLATPLEGHAPMLELYAQCWQNNCDAVVDSGDDCEFEPTCEEPDDQFAERTFSVYFERNLRVGRSAILTRPPSRDVLYQLFISYEWRSPADSLTPPPFRDRSRNASLDDFFPFTYGTTVPTTTTPPTTLLLTTTLASSSSAPLSSVDSGGIQFSTDALIIAGVSVGSLVLLLVIVALVTCYVRKHCVNQLSRRRARADANAVAMVPFDFPPSSPGRSHTVSSLPTAHIRLPAALERHPSQVPLMLQQPSPRRDTSFYDAGATMNFATAVDIPDIIDAANRPYSFTNAVIPQPIAAGAEHAPPAPSTTAIDDTATTTVALGSYAFAPPIQPAGFGVVLPPAPQQAPVLPRPAPKPLPARPIAYTMHAENPDFMSRPDY